MTLQFPDTETPSWARELPNGGEGGVRAFQIDGSGLDVNNYMMYRLTLPMGSAPSVRGSVRFKSTLEAFNASSEGFAARFRGYDDGGSQVWDSRPQEKGRRAWRADEADDWTDAVFVEPVPSDRGIVEITFELVVRANRGLLTVCKPECRYHYSFTVDCSLLGRSSFTGQVFPGVFSEQIILDDTGNGEGITRWVRYARTIPVDIQKGKLLSGYAEGKLFATATETQGATTRRLVGSTCGIMLKMRITGTGNYDFFTIIEIPTAENNLTRATYPTGSVAAEARNHYDQIEVQVFIQPTPIDGAGGWSSRQANGGASLMLYEDIEIPLTVADYLEPTQ